MRVTGLAFELTGLEIRHGWGPAFLCSLSFWRYSRISILPAYQGM